MTMNSRQPSRRVRTAVLSAALFFVGCSLEPPAEPTYEIPYRLTPTKHVMVRVKVNGKGPYNLVIDTGAPAVIFDKKLQKTIGIETEAGGWTTIDRLEVEGGLRLDQLTARFDELFQLEGMNGLGLAGAEIHGLIGYPVLARFRIEYDYTKTKLRWTELDRAPDELPRRQGRGVSHGGLNALGSMMKGFGKLIGAGPAKMPTPRGFFGVTVIDQAGQVVISEVVADGPAATAGVMVGDVIVSIQSKAVLKRDQVVQALAQVGPGETCQFAVRRGGTESTLSLTAGRGF